MPAPPSGLLTALRSATPPQRHIFFAMTHSQGIVRVWDGVGDFVLAGLTYQGVGGFGELAGVSDSGDIQNHEITATLNGVALADLIETDTDIRGEVATITAAWLTEAGAVTASRVVAIAVGDCLKVKMDRAQKQLIAKLRGPLAEWRTPPRAYYTNADQQRRYSGDTGFQFVKSLENASVSGWSKDAESSGSVPKYSAAVWFYDSITFAVIGDNSWGANVTLDALDNQLESYASVKYLEETTSATTSVSADNTVQVGGINCYIDTAGEVRTAGGNRLSASGGGYLRRQGTIASDGTATATRVVVGDNGLQRGMKEGGNIAQNDSRDMVYCNKWGQRARLNGTVIEDYTDGVDYVEATTGTAATFSGGFLRVGGADCKVSTTGVILSPGNRRIVKSGGSASEFLRVWT